MSTKPTKTYKQVTDAPSETIRKIWLDILHSLEGQYDAIKDNSDMAMTQQLLFSAVWKEALFYDVSLDIVIRHFTTPRRPFPVNYVISSEDALP